MAINDIAKMIDDENNDHIDFCRIPSCEICDDIEFFNDAFNAMQLQS